MIDEWRAREIASWWHGGQWSDLYGFSSSGVITDKVGLGMEVEDCMKSENISAGDTRNLQELLNYIEGA